MQEVAVYRPGQGTAVGGHRGDHEQPHALQSFAYPYRAEAVVVADDVSQVSTRPGGAAVEQLLKAIDFLRSLQHVPIRPQPPPSAPQTGLPMILKFKVRSFRTGACFASPAQQRSA